MIRPGGSVLVNGQVAAGLPADDPGLERGLAIFETWRTYGRSPFRLEAHLGRLTDSANTMGIALPPRELILHEISYTLGQDVSQRLTLTAGGNRVLHTRPIDAARLGRPVTLGGLEWAGLGDLPGSVKHCLRAPWMMASRRLGVEEVLLVDPAGWLLETDRSNVFAVVDGVLVTPPAEGRILDGVTRRALIEVARELGLPLQVRPVRRDERFEELYVSSTLKELAPVSTLNGRPIGGGPLGEALYAGFRALVLRECRSRPAS